LTVPENATIIFAMDKALERAITIAGSQDALAAALGISKSQVSRWKNRHAPVPSRHAIRIERWSKGVIRAIDFDTDPQRP